jgi:hypothetical protein
MNKKAMVASAAAGVATVALAPVSAARATWSELTPGRVGFWTISYGDPYNQGSFGAYRSPDAGGHWGGVLPSWLDDPKSMDNDSRRTIYVYKNEACRSDGGRWWRVVSPNQRVNQTIGTDWRGIQGFSFKAPTPNQRSCS